MNRAPNGFLRRIRGAALAIAVVGGAPFSATAAGQSGTQAPSVEAVQILATGEIDLGLPVSASLRATPERIWLRLEAEGAARDLPLTVPIAVSLLADRRLSFLWSALLQWSGEDLSRLRDARIAWTREAMWQAQPGDVPRTTIQSVSTPQIGALLSHADALSSAGRFDEAIQLLRSRLPSRLRGERAKQDFALLNVSIARTLRVAGRPTDLILATYDQAMRQVGANPFGLNLKVNRAALLANVGRYEEALRAIDEASVEFTRHNRFHVPGSDRQFNWIRACALHGLGRTAQARAIVDALETWEEPSSSAFVLEPNDSIRMRLRICMRDAQAVIDELIRIARTDGVFSLAALAQPDYVPPHLPSEILAAIRSNSELQALLVERLRQLPATVLPALRQWQAPKHD